jgi:hypothetical protein
MHFDINTQDQIQFDRFFEIGTGRELLSLSDKDLYISFSLLQHAADRILSEVGKTRDGQGAPRPSLSSYASARRLRHAAHYTERWSAMALIYEAYRGGNAALNTHGWGNTGAVLKLAKSGC